MGGELSSLLAPYGVAVVGAGPASGSVGGEILRNLVRCGHSGPLYAVNPKYDEVAGVPCMPSVDRLPDFVDLAILAVPRDAVLRIVDACGGRGIRNLIIVTAGFKESGREGAELEDALRHLIARHRLRVIGPNCMGILRRTGEVQLNASFSRWFPEGGNIAFISQSGSLGETLLECFAEAGLGVSLFVNLGNRAGLTEDDFLAELADDPSCGAVFLYLESFANPAAFRRLVEDMAPRKPVVVLKAGRTEAGAAAVASHTGSLASSDAIVDAFLRQSGALRVTTVQETLTALRALERRVLPKGRRTLVLTNAGGAGILAADACERAGLDVPRLSEDVQDALRSVLVPEAGTGNPVDLLATAGARAYEAAIDIGLREADAAVVIFRPPLVLPDPPVAVADAVISAASRWPDKPVVVSTLSEQSTEITERFHAARLPVFAMPETAVEALSVLARASLVQKRQTEDVPVSYSVATAQRVIRDARRETRIGLTFSEGATLLSAYGIGVCASRYVGAAEDLRAAVAGMRFPLAAKLDSPQLLHRVEENAVALDLKDPGDVKRAVERLLRSPVAAALPDARVLVQEMQRGRELILGVKRDGAFGPVVMFGIGGTYVEAFHDVAFAVAPLTQRDAISMVSSIRAARLLGAFRGQPAVDLGALTRALVALGQLALDVRDIEEIDVNPLFADAENLTAVDVLVRLSSPVPRDRGGESAAETE
ncbi:MAG: acetate--CoA ligase family protein [Candidatus Bipolaricaulota bacterium]